LVRTEAKVSLIHNPPRLRLMKLIRIEDPVTTCCYRFRIPNSRVCSVLGVFQLFISLGALAQHVYSILTYGEVFKCHFGTIVPAFDGMTAEDIVNVMLANITDRFLAADIIIFDYGLFHVLLGIPGCVANQFDGGYMRGLWCISYVGSLTLLLMVIGLGKPRPRALLPILLQQSVYMLGLIMLSLATIRKLLSALTGNMTWPLFRLILCYFSGASLNCYYGITLWHFYWFWKRASKSNSNVVNL